MGPAAVSRCDPCVDLLDEGDFVEGHQLQLTNADGSRTLAAIYRHENKLYILEGTVPEGYPEPGIFQQSMGWIDENGKPFRYRSLYHNGFPAPPR